MAAFDDELLPFEFLSKRGRLQVVNKNYYWFN